MNQKAPVALFVYNRPEHTRKTLEALKRNHSAKDTHLFIFADGFRTNASGKERQQLSEVRQLVREKMWCGKVDIIESAENKGLKQSICNGISHVLDSFDRVVVLEDDLETSPGFLEYMNDALTLYENTESVFQVSGFMVKNGVRHPETGFLRVSTSWGWGTWRRAWRCYRDDAENLLTEVERKGRTAFDLDGYSFHFEELERNVKGELNTWAVRWYASVFLNGGLCLYPRKTLVRNHGFDGTGVHCHDDSSGYHHSLKLANRITVKEQPLTENLHYMKSMQLHYKQMLQLWTGTRFRDRLIRKIRNSLGK